MRSTLLVFAAACLLIGACGTANSMTSAEGPVAPTSTPTISAERKAELLAEVKAKGSLPIIVTLNIRYSTASLPPAEERKQQERIAEAQAGLIRDLKPFKVTVRVKLKTLPQIALTVNEAALKHLLTSHRVAAIQREKTAKTAG